MLYVHFKTLPQVYLVQSDRIYGPELFSTEVSTAELKVTAHVPLNELYYPMY
jgi:hypothetical protein